MPKSSVLLGGFKLVIEGS